jgi:hypothetical protein
MRTSRASKLAEDWDALQKDQQQQERVLSLEKRYREIADKKQHS